MSTPWWLTFADGTRACVESDSPTGACEKAITAGKDPVKVNRIPYPAQPFVGERESTCPPFCFTPDQCQGRGSCPRNRACDD